MDLHEDPDTVAVDYVPGANPAASSSLLLSSLAIRDAQTYIPYDETTWVHKAIVNAETGLVLLAS